MEQVMNLVDQLAVKLGVAVEHLWTILTKQQYAEGIIDIILAVLCLGILITIIVYAPKLTINAANEYKKLEEDRKQNGTGYNGSKYTPSFEEDHYNNLRKDIPKYSIVVGCIVFVSMIMFIVCGIQQIINPEYFAIREILNCIKNPG